MRNGLISMSIFEIYQKLLLLYKKEKKKKKEDIPVHWIDMKDF